MTVHAIHTVILLRYYVHKTVFFFIIDSTGEKSFIYAVGAKSHNQNVRNRLIDRIITHHSLTDKKPIT